MAIGFVKAAGSLLLLASLAGASRTPSSVPAKAAPKRAKATAPAAEGRAEAPTKAPFPYIWGKAYLVLPETNNHGSGYKSLCEGLNHRIYVGTAKYGENSYLVEFDPVTEKQRIVVDSHRLIGQTETGYAAQAKIHTRNFVGPSGVIYVGTKQGYPQAAEKEACDIPPYRGGHVITYDPKTDQATDLGIPWPGYGVIDTVADEAHGLIYVVTCEDPFFWMAYDMKTKRYRWLGPEVAANCTTVIDLHGRANQISRDFKLLRYDPATNKLTRQPILLDGQKLTGWDNLERHRIPLWNLAADGRTAYLTTWDQATLYRLDLGGADTGPVNMETLGTLVEGDRPDSRCCLTIAPDGRVYAVVSVVNATGFGEANRRLFHLARFDPKTNRCTDLGVLAVKNPDFFNFSPGPDGKAPPNSHGYQTLPDGTLTVKHNTMAMVAAHDGSLYVTVLYPFTLLRIDPGALP